MQTPINYNEDLFKSLWNKRNPQHETNYDDGKNMFWRTAFMVFEDYLKFNQTPIEEKKECCLKYVENPYMKGQFICCKKYTTPIVFDATNIGDNNVNMLLSNALRLLSNEERIILINSLQERTGFDAKKVAEGMKNNFEDVENMGRFSDNGYSGWSTRVLNEQSKECVKIALTYSHFTQSQQSAIIDELNKL